MRLIDFGVVSACIRAARRTRALCPFKASRPSRWVSGRAGPLCRKPYPLAGAPFQMLVIRPVDLGEGFPGGLAMPRCSEPQRDVISPIGAEIAAVEPIELNRDGLSLGGHFAVRLPSDMARQARCS